MWVLGDPVGLDAILKYAARAPVMVNDSASRDPGSNVGFAATNSGVPLTGLGRVETDTIGIVSEFTLYRRHSDAIGR
jgi:hypothetical protein